jgi:IMP dehydrogenase
MKLYLSFDDILINPKFNFIKSRKDVSTKVNFLGLDIFPVLSSNMDSVTGSKMASAMKEYGALGCLHRFMSIEDNVKEYLASPSDTISSIGLGEKELNRAQALVNVGCKRILIDVAHGASMEVVRQVKHLRELFNNDIYVIVGNFANRQSIEDFKYYLGNYKVDAWKVGIGGGSACLTRVVTGCGAPTLASILDCKGLEEPIIADGGIRTSGDMAKALAAGAAVVMLGGMLAGSEESPGESHFENKFNGKYLQVNGKPSLEPMFEYVKTHKKYRGSASQESYEVQGKNDVHRAAEGDSFLVPYTGPVSNTLQKLEGGLRSAMTYVGASNIVEFQENVDLIQITNSGAKESQAHGKNNN